MPIHSDQTLDCSGLACPLPILKTKKAMEGLAVGQILEMIATDPGSPSDMDAWCQKTGQQLVDSKQEGDKFIFYIKRMK
ncbi:MAG: sulfurtransferase TusA family protein [Candidatus Aminicenantes bacterium]|nr:sulfurtransferase TusA family protein [Candidatus Aminicenantes bacterium]